MAESPTVINLIRKSRTTQILFEKSYEQKCLAQKIYDERSYSIIM